MYCGVQCFSAKLRTMKRSYLNLCFIMIHSLIICVGLIPLPTFSQNNKNKSKLNTQVFEAEGEQNTFSGKVRILRDNTEDTEVFFENKKHPGPYILSEKLPSYGLFKARLQKSKKSGGPAVKVTVDNDHIKSVDIDGNASPSTLSEKDLMDSVFKK